MKWLLVLAVAGRLAAQSAPCGIIPTPQAYDGTNGSSPVPAAQTTYNILIDTGGSDTCAWKVSTTVSSWITFSATSGIGAGGFTWTAAANLTNVSRAGYIVVNDWAIYVVQLGATCVPTLPVTSAAAVVGGGPGSFAVQTFCEWNAFSNTSSWITLQAPTSGTGNGSVSYTVGANPCVVGRSGTITAEAGTLARSTTDGAALFTVNQSGSSANLTLSAASLEVSSAGGPGKLGVTTGAGCTWTAFTDSQNWLQLSGASGSGVSNISYNVLANPGLPRTGHIYVGPDQAVFIVTQDAAAPAVPQITALASAASYAAGPIAPGEVVALGGTGLGPTVGVGLELAPGGQSVATTLGGVQVLFDGKYPAALTYARQDFVEVITPYEIAGENTTQIQVIYQGGTSTAFEAQVQSAAPGIFTLDQTGSGNGAILNQDYSVNGKSNPAPRGSIVMIFSTGAGPTVPPSTDAAITTTDSTLAVQPVSVTIGGIPVPAQQVSYAGGAPSAVAGLTQINAMVPTGVSPGPGVSVSVQIGNWPSQSGVTLAVQ